MAKEDTTNTESAETETATAVAEKQTPKKAAKTMTMEELLESSGGIRTLSVGDVVEGTVISVAKNEIWLDLGPQGTGLVSGREFEEGLAVSTDVKPGDVLQALVVDTENEDGYVILSLKRASRERVWLELEDRMKAEEVIEVKAFDANKGGLLIEVDGIRGFLPVSQLIPEHYPRISSGDKDEILLKLSQLVGTELKVRIIDVNRKENKLIFSEKAAYNEARADLVSKYKVGDVVDGKVTGIVDFGIFMNFDGIEGLIHISEISWERVDDPNKFAKVGEAIKAQIISIEGEKISLSMKRLQKDPWLEAAKKLKLNEKIEGTVTRLTPFGAFVSLGPSIEALVHISELSQRHVADPAEVLKVGEKRTFVITSIDLESHKLALSLKALEAPAPTRGKKAADAEEEAPKTSGAITLPGISTGTSKKLAAAGYDTIESLQNATAEELVEKGGISAATAAKVVAAVAAL
jgi:small subunit ribosomal protein S1